MPKRAANGARQLVAPKSQQSENRPDEGLEPRHQLALRRQHVARLARDDNLVASAPERAAQHPLAFALAVDVGRVEEVDPGVERRREEVDELRGFALKDPADAGAAQAEFRDEQVRSAKRSAGDGVS